MLTLYKHNTMPASEFRANTSLNHYLGNRRWRNKLCANQGYLAVRLECQKTKTKSDFII